MFYVKYIINIYHLINFIQNTIYMWIYDDFI